jgi:hypothetical protein
LRLRRDGQAEKVTPRSAQDGRGNWSPFARNDGADCQAVAEALLRALDQEACSLDELTPTRYAELRRLRPQMGLPRTTTVTAVCGSWQRAVEAAERHAAALTRRAAFS